MMVLISPEPSPTPAPCPCTLVNLRWNNWRPRRTERNGSQTIMNREELGVLTSPRPAPISSLNDLLMPAFAALGAWVLSIICAIAPDAPTRTPVQRQTMSLLTVKVVV